MIKLCTVSNHFREIAGYHLYSYLSHDISDHTAGGPSLGMPTDRLASILETLATSDHNYARHVKGIFVGTEASGDRAEQTYKEYGYEYSAGKFLNTLLLATLKKTKALETFQ